MVVLMLHNAEKCAKYDLRCIRLIKTGAAPLGSEVAVLLRKLIPNARVAQGYGMTETSPIATWSNEFDIVDGSSGSVVPGNKMKLVAPDGSEITSLDTPGELWIQGPNVVLGYLNNAKADAETFVWDDDGRWIKTGDEALARNSPGGDEVFYIVDRIKELIKTKVWPSFMVLYTHTEVITNEKPTGPSSSTCRARSPPSHARLRCGLRRYPGG